jgi:hypothetical protein
MCERFHHWSMSQSTNATAAELRLLHDVAAGRDDQIVFQSVKGPIGSGQDMEA